MGPTDEEIFCFGKLLRQRRGSRPFTAIREGCVRPPCGSKPTDTWEAAADARTKGGPSGFCVGNGRIVGERNPSNARQESLPAYSRPLQSPWSVSEVKLDMESQEIRVRVEHPRGTKFGCPDCQQQLSCYDHGEERQRRHLDSCQFKTILTARVPRVECPTHGVTWVMVPWASPNSRFTMLFERFAIDVLKMTQTVKERLSNIMTFCTHGITSGVAEGINSKIMSIKRRAGGYRNIENFKKAIFFYCGGLDLYPR